MNISYWDSTFFNIFSLSTCYTSLEKMSHRMSIHTYIFEDFLFFRSPEKFTFYELHFFPREGSKWKSELPIVQQWNLHHNHLFRKYKRAVHPNFPKAIWNNDFGRLWGMSSTSELTKFSNIRETSFELLYLVQA